MNLSWQDFTAVLIVLAAAMYLVHRAWTVLARRRAAGCGSCPTCPSNESPTVTVVGIKRPAKSGSGQ